jgi:hypothetical protein
MVDPLGIVKSLQPDKSPALLICNTCKVSLDRDVRPKESLANYRWVGAVPPELQGLSWIEELLIARAHLTGRIIRLQNRIASSHFGLKGHVILLPPRHYGALEYTTSSFVLVTGYCPRGVGGTTCT